jgi:undecaprenyl-diphosphatase
MLTNIDYQLFIFFNTAFANPFFDAVFPIITKESNLTHAFFIAIAVHVAVSKDKILAAKRSVVAILLFAVSDAIAYRVIKAFFERLRPCNPIYFVDNVHLLFPQCRFILGQNGSFSFPSNHAVNLTAMTLIWSLWCPKLKYFLIPAALLLIFTRVYCGVHYPIDLFFGMIFGIAFGFAAYYASKPFVDVTRQPNYSS